jgi:hypothetical protein
MGLGVTSSTRFAELYPQTRFWRGHPKSLDHEICSLAGILETGNDRHCCTAFTLFRMSDMLEERALLTNQITVLASTLGFRSSPSNLRQQYSTSLGTKPGSRSNHLGRTVRSSRDPMRSIPLLGGHDHACSRGGLSRHCASLKSNIFDALPLHHEIPSLLFLRPKSRPLLRRTM